MRFERPRSNQKRVFWDSSCFLSLLNQNPDRLPALLQWIARAEAGEIEIFYSEYALIEVGKIDSDYAGELRPEEQESRILRLFDAPYCTPIQVTRRVAALTREILRSHDRLPGKDAVHIACALGSEAYVLHTYDSNHLIPKSGKIGNPPLIIERPPYEDRNVLPGLEEVGTP